eukprot:365664-Chlamydomonas_euryale.AAC.10
MSAEKADSRVQRQLRAMAYKAAQEASFLWSERRAPQPINQPKQHALPQIAAWLLRLQMKARPAHSPQDPPLASRLADQGQADSPTLDPTCLVQLSNTTRPIVQLSNINCPVPNIQCILTAPPLADFCRGVPLWHEHRVRRPAGRAASQLTEQCTHHLDPPFASPLADEGQAGSLWPERRVRRPEAAGRRSGGVAARSAGHGQRAHAGAALAGGDRRGRVRAATHRAWPPHGALLHQPQGVRWSGTEEQAAAACVGLCDASRQHATPPHLRHEVVAGVAELATCRAFQPYPGCGRRRPHVANNGPTTFTPRIQPDDITVAPCCGRVADHDLAHRHAARGRDAGAAPTPGPGI